MWADMPAGTCGRAAAGIHSASADRGDRGDRAGNVDSVDSAGNGLFEWNRV